MVEQNVFCDELINATFMYCYRRLSSAADAEDLAQDIMCEALAGLRKRGGTQNFAAWYWTLAHNRFCLFLRKKKYRAASLEEYGGSIACDGAPDDGIADAEETARLNVALSRLSALHREVIVAFYLRGESIAEISQRLGVPEGTIKRRLHDAKIIAKKGFDEMDNTGRSAYAPAELNLWGAYSIPDYWDKIEDIMTKQIFVTCRNQARSVREIADEIGVAPVYFEEKLKYLLDNKFLKETSNGKYITDFVILPTQVKVDFNYELSLVYESIGVEVTDTIKSVEDKIRALGFYGCDFEFDYLLWILYVYACMTLSEIMLGIYHKKWVGKVPEGNGKNYRISGNVTLSDEKINYRNVNNIGWSNLQKGFITADYKHIIHANLFQSEPFGNRDKIITDENADLVMKLFDNSNYKMTPVQEEQAARLIRHGYLKRDDSGLHLTMPVMTFNQKNQIEEIFAVQLHPLAIKYVEKVSELSDRMLLPQIREDLLEEYVNWTMLGNFWPLNYVFHYGLNVGKTLTIPEDFVTSAAGIALYYMK